MIAFDNFILSVLQHSPLANAIYDNRDLNIAYANQAMLDMWCADESIIGKTFCQCFPNFEQEGFSSILKNVWKTGITYRATDAPANIVVGESKIKRYFDFEYKALTNENGLTYAILHTASDVTDRKLVYNRMERQREQISLNCKLVLLVETLAHDLKNPLSTLKLGVDFLSKNDISASDTAMRWYKNFASSIQNIESIINQTLQLNQIRGTINKSEIIAVDEKIAGWINEIRLCYPEQQMDFRLGNLYPIQAEGGAVYQVFANLIGNAIKYAAKSKDAYLYIHSELTDKGMVYIFEDNGIGVPEKELRDVFKLQVRGSNTGNVQGTGIGLSLVKDLMEFMGGTINLSSELGKGTVMRLYFPSNEEKGEIL